MMRHRTYYLLMLLAIFACSSETKETTCMIDLAEAKLSDAVINAGQTVSIQLEVATFCDSESLDIYFSGLGISTFETLELNNKTSHEILIPDRYLKKAGLLDIRFEDNPNIALVLKIKAADANGIVDVYSGPKTIAADYHQPAMIVSIPKDKFGNPAKSGTMVNYGFESSVIEAQKIHSLKHLHSYVEIPLQEQVGKIYMSAAADNAQSKESFLEIKPGSPTDFKITANRINQFANEKENTIFQTDQIFDKFSNLVVDGTKVLFNIFENDRQIGVYDAITIGGSAKVSIQNPSKAKTIIVSAQSMGATSNQLQIEYKNILDDIPYKFDQALRKISIGPLQGGLGNVVPDGFLITVLVTSKGKFIYEKIGEIENGIYSIKIPDRIKGDQVKLICGGLEKVINI